MAGRNHPEQVAGIHWNRWPTSPEYAPVEQSSPMILLVMVAYVIQVPSLAFFAQKLGKRIVAFKV
jgi:hypothetical protein